MTLQGKIRRVRILLTVFMLLAAISSRAFGESPASQPAADWSRLATEKWPQLVLTNEASFDGHTPLHGASAFLVQMPDGEILAATAKHLIKAEGGVDPPVQLVDLDRVLTTWKLFPRTRGSELVEAKGVAERTSGETRHDWLLLHLVNNPTKLPATPLVPRIDPVKIGERVYLVGVPYSDRKSAQNVYEGIVTARPSANYFTYDVKPPVHIAGFSGAPIVDANGLLVGHGVSRSKELKQVNGLEVEFGGEDATLALELWRHRNDPPATKPADSLHLTLPQGWITKQSKLPNVIQFAEYPPLVAYFELVASPKADFSDDMTLMKWAALSRSTAAKTSKLENRSETELKTGSVAGRSTVEYEITGEIKGVKLRYRMIMLECNGCYCRLICWTTPSHWDEAQPKFEEVVRLLK
jgi:hypothetical protein